MAFGTGLYDAGTGDNAEINMIPLIDVMLVLLVIFTITAPLMTHAVTVNLPAAASQPIAARPDAIALSIRADGSVYWNDARSRRKRGRLAWRAPRNRSRSPHFTSGRWWTGLQGHRTDRIMADAARAGLTKLGFITDPLKDS